MNNTNLLLTSILLKQQEQQKVTQAQQSDELHLKDIHTDFEVALAVIAFLLPLPILIAFTVDLFTGFLLLCVFLWSIGTYVYNRYLGDKVYVQNIATGQKFYISREEWVTYKQIQYNNANQTKKLYDDK